MTYMAFNPYQSTESHRAHREQGGEPARALTESESKLVLASLFPWQIDELELGRPIWVGSLVVWKEAKSD